MKFIMVLNDGETYTDLNGCSIIGVPDDYDIEDIELGLANVNDGTPTSLTVITTFNN